MSKHTKGPWMLSPNNDEAVVTAVGSFYWLSWSHLPHQHEQYGIDPKADARLIAAAPELLSALIRLEAELTEDRYGPYYEPSPYENLGLARAAILKATGEQP